MSRIIRLGIAAGLALTASAAWAAAGRPDDKTAGGEVWYDEFYASASPGAATPTPAAAAASRGPRASAVPGQPSPKRAQGDDRAHARRPDRRLARSR
jgi:hypothetical protein